MAFAGAADFFAAGSAAEMADSVFAFFFVGSATEESGWFLFLEGAADFGASVAGAGATIDAFLEETRVDLAGTVTFGFAFVASAGAPFFGGMLEVRNFAVVNWSFVEENGSV